MFFRKKTKKKSATASYSDHSSNQDVLSRVQAATRSGPASAERMQQILSGHNPLLEVAQPLLRALTEVQQLQTASEGEALANQVRLHLVELLRMYQMEAEQAMLLREHVIAARFCLCTALDEAILGLPWGESWANDSLLVKFHVDTQGGETVFHLLGRLAQQPEEHWPVLEVIYRLLGLGFEGRYRNRPEGARQLEAIRQRLLALLGAQIPSPDYALSPNWQGESQGRFKLMRSIPVGLSIVVLSLVLLGMYSWFKYQLFNRTDVVVKHIENTINIPDKPKPIASLKLAVLLKDEIAKGTVKVDDSASQSKLTFKGDGMFISGAAIPSKSTVLVMSKVADELKKVHGQVSVVGHTDSSPIHTAAFPNNQVLSEKRAQSVADLLIAGGVEKSRVQVIGKGATEPTIEDAKTSADNAQNRRVEITVKY